MIFDQGVAPQDALDFLNQRVLTPAPFTSSEWQDVPAELRARAFFSSQVESAQALQATRGAIQDFLANARDESVEGSPLKTGSRADFVDQMQQFLAENGVVRTTGDIQDITSQGRLGLIFNTMTRQANDYGYWKQGMDADVLAEFPAMRFIRVFAVKEPRLNHAIYQGKVFLKTDPIWFLKINQDFGVPWGPWGWGCGHDVEDVDWREAQSLGLRHDPEAAAAFAKKWKFNTGLQASVKNLDPDLIAKLKQVFGDRIVIEGDVIKWNASAAAETVAPAPTESAQNVTPVSDAMNVKVRGALADQVNLALKAIDQVHDDGTLPDIDIKSTNRSYLGVLTSVRTVDGMAAESIAIRASGEWPALTTAHEVGHFLDLEAIGTKGSFATLAGDADMQAVLQAAEKSAAIQGLRARLAGTGSFENTRYYSYLLRPQEIWARAYAQFIAERSGMPAMAEQLKASMAGESLRQWAPDDFAPVADAIETMFNNLGWM